MMNLQNKKILVIVTGGIASYKSLDIIRRLQENGSNVECILTENAKKFVNEITFESLLGKKIHSNLFSLTKEKEMSHIKLANIVDLILIVPCTANFLAKMANGIADDLASNIILASDKIKVIAPAMNSNMWMNKAVKKNINYLGKMGVNILFPEKGKMACGTTGAGKLMNINDITQNLDSLLSPKYLSNIKVIISAGPSEEQIDTVRFISNYSSGKQGYEIAKSLASLGANTILITGKTNLEKPNNVRVVNVSSAKNFHSKILLNLPCDVFISAAAISDWKAKKISNKKLKKENDCEFSIKFTRNIDVLKEVSHHKKRPGLVIGFSAETSELIKNSKSKLKNKGCDWIIANNVRDGEVFGSEYNKISFISNNKTENWPKMKKSEVAKKISKKIVNFFKKNKLV